MSQFECSSNCLTHTFDPKRALRLVAASHLLELMQDRSKDNKLARLEPWVVARDSTAVFAGN